MSEEERLGRIDASLASLERSAAGIERVLVDQRTFNEQLITRVERGAFAGIRELSRMNDDLERQGEKLERQVIELERRAGERRAESKMEREALLRILERL